MRFIACATWALGVFCLSSSGADCTFTRNPEDFLLRETRFRQELYQRALPFKASNSRTAVTDPRSIPRRNLIDERIFGKMSQAGVPSAVLTTDEEFLRRIFLDLTGTLPTPSQVTSFL